MNRNEFKEFSRISFDGNKSSELKFDSTVAWKTKELWDAG